MLAEPARNGVPPISHDPEVCLRRDDKSNLQLLCVPCHEEKTRLESHGVEDSNPLLSCFNLETDKLFVESPNPHQLVCNLHEPRKGDALEIDIARSRLSAYVHADV